MRRAAAASSPNVDRWTEAGLRESYVCSRHLPRLANFRQDVTAPCQEGVSLGYLNVITGGVSSCICSAFNLKAEQMPPCQQQTNSW